MSCFVILDALESFHQLGQQHGFPGFYQEPILRPRPGARPHTHEAAHADEEGEGDEGAVERVDESPAAEVPDEHRMDTTVGGRHAKVLGHEHVDQDRVSSTKGNRVEKYRRSTNTRMVNAFTWCVCG